MFELMQDDTNNIYYIYIYILMFCMRIKYIFPETKKMVEL